MSSVGENISLESANWTFSYLKSTTVYSRRRNFSVKYEKKSIYIDIVIEIIALSQFLCEKLSGTLWKVLPYI